MAWSRTTFAIWPVGPGFTAFLLNPQGRILGDMYVYNLGESLIVETDRSQVEKIVATFDHYIIMDDVEIVNDISEKQTALGLAGPKSRAMLNAAGIEVPELRALADDHATMQLRLRVSWSARWCAVKMPGDEQQEILRNLARAQGCLQDLAGAGGCRSDAGGQRGSGDAAHCGWRSALWRGYSRARPAAGDRADAGAQFQQGLLRRTGDCRAHSLARQRASQIYGLSWWKVPATIVAGAKIIVGRKRSG